MSRVKKRSISIIGLGYVGLPLAISFGKSQRIIGFDINQKRINELKNGVDSTNEINATEFELSDINFTSDFDDLSKADFHIIAVPTPVDEYKKPNLEFLLLASRTVGKILKKGDVVVYESTVYPGTTEDVCLPILEDQSGLKCGEDFFIGYSPERINPGDKVHIFEKIIKVVSAQDEGTLEIIYDTYLKVVSAGVFKAPSIKVAEAAKVIENTQRDLNIALVNELAILFKRMEIDTHDVLEAAGTKWNFLEFEPGLVGGHCISVDPYYLTHKSISLGYTPEIILAGRSINDSIGKYIAGAVIKKLKLKNKDLTKIIITILGITFKENVSDIRNTRIIDILQTLEKHPVTTQVYDPYANKTDVKNEYQFDLFELDELKKSDAIILAVPHNDFTSQGWKLMTRLLNEEGGIIYDVKSVLDRDKKPRNVDLLRL